MGRAVSRSRANGADPFSGRLKCHGRTLMEAILFTSEEEKSG